MPTTRKNKTIPDTATLRAWAVQYHCDPRTIAKELARPGAVKGLAGQRIRAAIADLAATGALAVRS